MMNLALLLGLIFSFSAQAYTPPTGFILNQMLKNREALKELSFVGTVKDLKRNAVFKESVYINFQSGKVTLTYLSANDDQAGVVHTSLGEIHRLGKFWFGVALDPNVARFRKALEDLNALPTEKSVANLSRLDSVVTWSYGEESLIQFYKDEFLAADYQSGVGESLNEVYFKEYSKTGSTVRIPKVALIKEKAQDLFSFELNSMKINTPIEVAAEPSAVTSASVQEWIKLVR